MQNGGGVDELVVGEIVWLFVSVPNLKNMSSTGCFKSHVLAAALQRQTLCGRLEELPLDGLSRLGAHQMVEKREQAGEGAQVL